MYFLGLRTTVVDILHVVHEAPRGLPTSHYIDGAKLTILRFTDLSKTFVTLQVEIHILCLKSTYLVTAQGHPALTKAQHALNMRMPRKQAQLDRIEIVFLD